jgi:hypothetical protein
MCIRLLFILLDIWNSFPVNVFMSFF